MNRLLKFFWFVSLALFLAGILLVYAFLPDSVGITTNEWGMPDTFITKEHFFYLGLLAFLVANGLLFALYRLLMITRRSVRTAESIALRTDVGGWLLGFAASLNIFFIMIMSFFSLINTTENYDTGRYMILVYGGPLLLLLMFILLLYILKKRKGQITG